MRALAVGRLVLLPVRPCVPAVGLELLLGRALALAEPVLLEALPAEALPLVGRETEAPLIDPFTVRPPETLALLLEGRRELIEPFTPLLPCLTLAT